MLATNNRLEPMFDDSPSQRIKNVRFTESAVFVHGSHPLRHSLNNGCQVGTRRIFCPLSLTLPNYTLNNGFECGTFGELNLSVKVKRSQANPVLSESAIA